MPKCLDSTRHHIITRALKWFFLLLAKKNLGISGGGKRRNEFAEWYVAWPAELHNYADCDVRRMTQRNQLN